MSGQLFGGVFARGEAAAAVGDRAWLAAMVEVEVALAGASADAGLLPRTVADRIATAAPAVPLDAGALGAAAAAGAGNPVPALVRALAAAIDDGSPEGAAAAGALHRGATSQDVLDSAAMLVVRRALGPTVADLDAAAERCAALAAAHRDTPVIGRTLLQQAVPTSFGLVAAGWLNGLDEATAELRRCRDDVPALQLGGAVGTLAPLGRDGIAIHAALARRLQLREPALPWHTVRVRLHRLAGALGAVAALTAKIAGDVVLGAQTEIGELSEAGDGRGGSSTMPHKRNPVAAVGAVACATRVPGLVATLLTAGGLQQHQRAAGGWQAEWETLCDLLRLTGAAAAWLRESLERLRVDPRRMAENLERTGGLVHAEAVAAALAPALGGVAAHDLVADACRRAAAEGTSLRDALLADPEVAGRLGTDGVDRALDPRGHHDSGGAFVDRALATHRARTGDRGR